MTFNGLDGAISQVIELFTTTAVRTTNPTRNIYFKEPDRPGTHGVYDIVPTNEILKVKFSLWLIN
jgi:hypothetical protein